MEPTQTTTWEALLGRADRSPDLDALVLPSERVTYGALRRRAERTAGSLAAAGVGRGDRVLLATHNSVEWVVWYLALGRLGAVAVPVNPRSTVRELGGFVERSGSRAALTGASCAAAADVLPGLPLVCWDGETTAPAWTDPLPAPREPDTPPPGPDDAAIIQYTSGSTAAPKGAVLPHRAVTGVAAGFGRRLDLCGGDRIFSGSPFFHVGGTVLLLATAAAVGGTAVALPSFEARAALGLIERERCVLFSGVEPHFLLVLAAEGYDPARLASVRKATSTGAPAVLRRISAEMELPGMVGLYGLSETASNLTMSAVEDPAEWRLDTCGYPHEGTEVRILVPGTEETAPPGEVGEIAARGFSVMSGYWNQPEETAAATTSDGWLRTGDLGSVGQDGLLRFAGRVKDMLRVGGENVAAADVEQVLLSMPEVRQAAVVGGPHPRLGEVPVAFVTLTGGNPERVRDALLERLPGLLSSFKCPREIVVLDELPMTGSGKIHKPTLRGTLAERKEQT